MPEWNDYIIYEPAKSVTKGPTYEQKYPLCPVSCYLTDQNGVDMNPNSMAMTFNSQLPSYTIRTVDQDYDQSRFDLCIKCVSVKSQQPFEQSTALNLFTVFFKSFCYVVPLVPAVKTSYQIPLYREDLKILDQVATVDAICTPIRNQIVLDDSTAQDPVQFVFSQDSRIFVNPMSRANLGVYNLRIVSCIDVGSGDNVEARCESSNPFTVTIVDPCKETNIVAYGFPADFEVEVPIMRSVTFKVSQEIMKRPNAVFPWPNDVDLAVDGSVYGEQVCGPMEFRITQLDPPVAILNSDMTITVSPEMGVHQQGTYKIFLEGRLVDFDIIESVEFNIKVISCQSTIDVSNVVLPLIENTWYMDSVSYDMSPVGSMVVQEPACGYPLSYHAFWYDEGADELNPLPAEVTFQDNVITIGKCNPIGVYNPDDEQCNDGTEPHEKNFMLALEIILEDGTSSQRAIRYFDAVIYDPCELDCVDMTNLIDEQDYVLRTPSEVLIYQPLIMQKFPLCPLRGEFQRLNEAEYQGSVVLDFQTMVTPTDHPSLEDQTACVKIDTSDKALDGRFMIFEFKYTSMRSNDIAGEVTHVFRINFIDECYNTVVTPAINDDITIPLFEFFWESMLTYSTSSFKCEPIIYTLFVVESTATNPVEIFWNLDYNDYELYPDRFNMRGHYTLILRSCVPIRD